MLSLVEFSEDFAYNFKRGEIEYTAGQDYNEEMKTLRGIFD